MNRVFHIQFDIDSKTLDYNAIVALIVKLSLELKSDGNKLTTIAIFEENDEYPNQTIEFKSKE